MANEEDEFEAWMSRLQVHKMGDAAAQDTGPPDGGDQTTGTSGGSNMDEFEEAMRTLQEVPDKDRPVSEATSDTGTSRVTLPARQRIAIAATLDLHGCTEAEAVRALRRFVRHCVEDGLSPVLIVTGKGVHSQGGVSVLKPAVEGELSVSRSVRAFGDAPRPHGGRGALVVWLGAR